VKRTITALAVATSLGAIGFASPAANASPGGSHPQPFASLASLHSHVVNCAGQKITALTPPAGRRMPIGALLGHNDSAAVQRQQRIKLHWIVPVCKRGPQGSSLGHRAPARTHPAAGQGLRPDEVPATTVQYSANWSGFQTTGVGYTQVQAQWTVPEVFGNPAGGYTDSSIWPGLGDGSATNDELVQAGTSQTPGGYTAWYEVYPLESSKSISNMTVHHGDVVWVDVYHSSKHTAQIEFDDDTTGAATVFSTSWPTSDYIGTDADWIVERPESSGTYAELANFGEVTLYDADATNSAGTTQGLGDYNRDYFYMNNKCGLDGGPYLAQTGDIGENGTAFPVNWVGFGTRIKPC
jgi:Peptidase A4 family